MEADPHEGIVGAGRTQPDTNQQYTLATKAANSLQSWEGHGAPLGVWGRAWGTAAAMLAGRCFWYLEVPLQGLGLNGTGLRERQSGYVGFPAFSVMLTF